jgi:hypothetical protein
MTPPVPMTLNSTGQWATDRKRHFTREDIQVVNKHVKRCLTSVAIRDMQIKNHDEVEM